MAETWNVTPSPFGGFTVTEASSARFVGGIQTEADARKVVVTPELIAAASEALKLVDTATVRAFMSKEQVATVERLKGLLKKAGC